MPNDSPSAPSALGTASIIHQPSNPARWGALAVLAGFTLAALGEPPVGGGGHDAPQPKPEAPGVAPAFPMPEGLGDDPSVWPNTASYRNSDDWLWRHHDAIREMRPRVVVLNFANDTDEAKFRGHADAVAAGFAEATRHKGYENPDATPFIRFQIIKAIDLRDEPAKVEPVRRTSSRMPVKKDLRPGEPAIDYAALFSDEFAPSLGFEDPRTPGRFMNLAELVNAGWVHEVWFYAIHDAGDPWPGLETCEMKQFYDDACLPIAGKHGQAGNGQDRSMPWIGRSVRVAFFNPHRGPGCSLENYGHTMEWLANSRSIGYYRDYFYEFADFELDRTHGLPIGSFYRTSYDRRSGDRIDFPKPDRLELTYRGKKHEAEPFITTGGSAHFPPGARWHYDLDSPYTVLTTVETYRTRATPTDADEAREFSREKFLRYKDVAPDCMGQWVVYWFQSMPGLGNAARDREGRPMKNWWPFLYY
ncbi:MAG: hypothetical protein HRU70_01525 [Phycisphaeraceae bacterium]|nr:MAG: hypothetical protein HRU70_01525 [Phycisphaeraceae bacterium]